MKFLRPGKRVRKVSMQALRLGFVFTFVLSWVFSAWPQIGGWPPKVQESKAAGDGIEASNRSDTLSDSRMGVAANHTLALTVNNSITASNTLTFSWPSGFGFTGGANWYDTNWGFRKQIAIDYHKVSGSATSFPVLI